MLRIATLFPALALAIGCMSCASLDASAVQTTPDSKTDRPNIVFFLVDDMGWRDAGFSGSQLYETPAIDQLAEDGLVFTQAYAAYPRCVPSRFAIMSGINPARQQVPGGREALAAENVTFAEMLQDAGYATFFAGKWHLGHRNGESPEEQGFDINIGGGRAGAPGSYFFPYGSEGNKQMGPGLETGVPGEYLNDRLTDETIAFIENHRRRNADEPFLAVLSHYAVHTPLEAQADDVAAADDRLARLDLPSGPETVERDGETKLVQDNTVYAGMVASMDRSLGDIRAALEDLGIADNTVIIFTSDHGGLSNRGAGRGRELATSNLPLRAGKGHLYEGGIRVPMIAYWPGVTLAGGKVDAVVNGTDHFATLLELANVHPFDGAADSLSYLPALRGHVFTPERPVYWYNSRPRPNQTGDRAGAALRLGDWKFISRYAPGELDELYNLAVDPFEENNLVESEPTRVARMRQQLESWLDEIDAVDPQLRRRGDSMPRR